MVLQSDLEIIDVLKSLVPINNLSKYSIELIAAGSHLKRFTSDSIVFNEGDSDEYAYYLLEGELEFISTNNTNFHIVSGTDDACYPLAQFLPRQYSAKVIIDSLILVIDRILLDSLLVGNKTENTIINNSVEVNYIDNDDAGDWMIKILQSPLYTSISVENIQKIFSKIESLDVRKGDVVINQGDNGDYYYIIQIGRCQISQKSSTTLQDISLAELKEGDAFGEESIIADVKRNASVTMITDGRLMRLNKNDFKELILNPILQKIDMETAQNIVSKGAIWLDVRCPDEYQDCSMEGSLNIPLNLLRLQVDKLDNSRQYITCCDTGSRSSIAAFILAQHGYNVYQLTLDIKALSRQEDNNKTKIKQTVVSRSGEILPFMNSNETGNCGHVPNSEFHYEMNQLRQELDIIRDQFQELLHIKDIASDQKKSVFDDVTAKKLQIQRERVNLQTQNANKLIRQAQKMQDEIENEKRLIYKEVEKHRKNQEKKMEHIQKEINKRLLEEEKKVQAFYSCKANEIEKIKQLKQTTEQKYLARKIKHEIKQSNNDMSNQFQALESIKQEVKEHQKQEK